MKVLVIGAAGMLGRKLVSRLVESGQLGKTAITSIIRHDSILAPPPPASEIAIETHMGDFAAEGEVVKLLASLPSVIFHLAAIVSGEAESDFDKGYHVNLDGMRRLLEGIRSIGGSYRPRLVFTSSIAVFGAPFPECIDDDFLSAPLTSYGTQKAICELLLSDYSRHGFVDGMALRMPTVCVRPGVPNKAISGFFSNIIREPLVGKEAILPVDDNVRHWHVSPRSAVGFLIRAAELGGSCLGNRRALTLPGLSCTVAEQLEALRKFGGEAMVRRVKLVPDEAIKRIVTGWPQDFFPNRALALGFEAEKDFEEIIQAHIEDELGGQIPG